MIELLVASAHAGSCTDDGYRQADVILEGDVLSLVPYDGTAAHRRFLVRPTEVYRGEVSGDIEVGLYIYGVEDLQLVQPGTHLALVLSQGRASGCESFFRRSAAQEPPIGEEGPASVLSCNGAIPGRRVQDWAQAMFVLRGCARMPTTPVPWTLPSDWRTERVHPAHDLDGDGHMDLIVEVLGPGKRQSLVLFGPLDRARALPDGADLVLEHHVNGIGDFDGDGHLDLHVLLVREGQPLRSAVLSGPLRRGGAVRLGAERPGRVESDYDGDGRPDYVEISASVAFARVWTGLEPTWGQGAPTVTFVDSTHPKPRGVSLPVPMDADNDGVMELWWNGAPSRMYEGPLRGKIDLARMPAIPMPRPVGDVDGDGISEWRDGFVGPVFAGPWSADPEAPRDELFYLDPRGWLQSLGMDLTGDGIAEVVRVLEGRAVIEGIRSLPAPLRASWIEDDVGWVLVQGPQGLEVLALGPATSPTPPR